MSINTPANDFKTQGFILRRTNYGEADRILNILTPNGKISAIARSARKEKSKLAGGIEMFCLSEFGIHQKKDSLGTITSARMIKYYKNILSDLSKLELASAFLKKISIIAENSDSPDFYQILLQVLEALNNNYDATLIEVWFLFNTAQALGEDINLYRDTTGKKLVAEQTYTWDVAESALCPDPRGQIGTDEIKLMRLILSSNLNVVTRIKNPSPMLAKIIHIGKAINKM